MPVLLLPAVLEFLSFEEALFFEVTLKKRRSVAQQLANSCYFQELELGGTNENLNLNHRKRLLGAQILQICAPG